MISGAALYHGFAPLISLELTGSGAVCRSGTGVPPVNHEQNARATFKLDRYELTPKFPVSYIQLSAAAWYPPERNLCGETSVVRKEVSQ
jgi:hypothetical protein